MKLDDELSAASCKVDRAKFEERLVDLFHGEFRSWTDEDLLCNPRESLRYCNLVREAVRCSDLADSVILRALTNLRKKGAILDGPPQKSKTPKRKGK